MTDDFDALDRALFALPLDEPPAGMRDAILRATIDADAVAVVAVVPPAFRMWEIVAIGALLAVACWSGLFLTSDRQHAAVLAGVAYAFARVLGDPQTLLWLATGGAIVAWVAFAQSASGLPALAAARARRS